MITLNYVLTLSGILFAIAVAGVFLNRRNIIVLLMCIELMLLAVNFNFVAFSRFLGDISGQIFVFFILTVAAAEAAIGLAILVVLNIVGLGVGKYSATWNGTGLAGSCGKAIGPRSFSRCRNSASRNVSP